MSASSHYTKSILAAILLGLFAFILTEKTLHEHETVVSSELQGHAVTELVKTCALCDFKLSADADIPQEPCTAVLVLTQEFFSKYFTSFLPVSPYCLSERGPPVFLKAS